MVCIAGGLCLVLLDWGVYLEKKKALISTDVCSCSLKSLSTSSWFFQTGLGPHLKITARACHCCKKRRFAGRAFASAPCGGPECQAQDPQHNCLPQTDLTHPGSLFLGSKLNISLEK